MKSSVKQHRVLLLSAKPSYSKVEWESSLCAEIEKSPDSTLGKERKM